MENVVWSDDYKGFTIECIQDECVENPREWENAFTFVSYNQRRDGLGDKDAESPVHCLDEDEEKAWWRRFDEEHGRVFLYKWRVFEHGMYAFSIDSASGSGYPFNCPWDTRDEGFVFIEYEKAWKEFGNPAVKSVFEKSKIMASPEFRKKVKEAARCEMNVYEAYCNGEVYAFLIKDSEGEVKDSCGGFYGEDGREGGYMHTLAKESIDYQADKWETERKQAIHRKAMEILEEAGQLVLLCA